MSEETISKEYMDIGIVHYMRSARAKRLILRIKPDCSILVSIPKSSNIKQAEKFVLSKKEWIENTLHKVNKNYPSSQEYTQNIEKITRFHNLIIKENTSIKIPFIKISGENIYIFYPPATNTKSNEFQNIIKQGILKALKKESIEYITPRIKNLSQKFNLPYNKLSFRDNKTRWGSCSGNNNISLNIHLMKLPDELIDYIILHELAHVKYKNHSKSFRIFLDTLVNGDSRHFDKEIRNYNTFI